MILNSSWTVLLCLYSGVDTGKLMWSVYRGEIGWRALEEKHNLNKGAVRDRWQARLQRCCSQCPQSPDGSSHTTGGMWADSKPANVCVSKKLMKAILNLTRRWSGNWGRWQRYGRKWHLFHKQARLERANNMHIFPALYHVTVDKKQHYAHA